MPGPGTWIRLATSNTLTPRRTGFSRESYISNEADVAHVQTPSRLKPVLRDGMGSSKGNHLTDRFALMQPVHTHVDLIQPKPVRDQLIDGQPTLLEQLQITRNIP